MPNYQCCSKLCKNEQKLLKRHHEILKYISSGTFGAVLAVKDKKTGKVSAVKIIKRNKTNPWELSTWPRFQHRNILPVTSIKCYEQVNIFFTPLQLYTLSHVVGGSFGFQRRDFCKGLEWVFGVLNGLKYLHNLGVCHLDLKMDNVLISEHGDALVADFSAITNICRPTNRYMLPGIYRPPETWPLQDNTYTRRPMVDGEAFDVWSVGVLMFRIFVRRWLYSIYNSWWEGSYSFVFSHLQTDIMKATLERFYPAAEVNADTRRRIQNLLRGTLRLQPEKRPTVNEILNHSLFNPNETHHDFKEDFIWIKHQGVLGYKVSAKLYDMSKDFKLNTRTRQKAHQELKEILHRGKKEVKNIQEKSIKQERSEEQQLSSEKSFTKGKKIRNWFKNAWKSLKSCSCIKANED